MPHAAHRPTPALWLVVALAGAGCFWGGGGSAVPQGAPRLAEGSTPDPVRFEVVVPGRQPTVRARVARVLADSLFHVNETDPAGMAAYNLARLVKVRVEVMRAGRDSSRVSLTGETYVGDTTRRDSISGLPERWRLITASDPGAALLRGLARALRATRADAHAPQGAAAAGPADGAAAGAAGTGRPPRPLPPVVQGSATDPVVISRLAVTPVGRSLDVCRSPGVPAGWLVLYWRTDSTRCLRLPDERYPGEPNIMHIEREW